MRYKWLIDAIEKPSVLRIGAAVVALMIAETTWLTSLNAIQGDVADSVREWLTMYCGKRSPSLHFDMVHFWAPSIYLGYAVGFHGKLKGWKWVCAWAIIASVLNYAVFTASSQLAHVIVSDVLGMAERLDLDVLASKVVSPYRFVSLSLFVVGVFVIYLYDLPPTENGWKAE
jgi:hypothetical protein